MGVVAWTWILVGLSFALYVGVALYAKATSTREYYVSDRGIPPVLNGMATASDWISAAFFVSMAGVIAFSGRDGSVYLMGWTGGYVLLAVLLAPYLRKYGKYTVPQFVGERYYSRAARVVALLCAIVISFIYVAAQMRGAGVVFARFLGISIEAGVMIGMAVVLVYAVLGGMRGITYTQVAQYVVLTAAYLVPAIFISIMLTGNPVPPLGFGSDLSREGAALLGAKPGVHLLEVLDQISVDLGFRRYTEGWKPRVDVLMTTVALMAGTAGLPHIIVRFFTVPKIRDARSSVGWALAFIAVLYLTAPALAAFARTTLVKTLHDRPYADAPAWFHNWERTGLVEWADRNGDGRMQISAREDVNEVRIDQDVVVLATPEIARLPAWVVGLLAAGALAAALSTAAGLLLVIGAAVSHDLAKSILIPRMSERAELRLARTAVAVAVIVAGFFGVHPPGFVAEVVALAFGLAASSFFPILVLGIFWKRATKEGAMAGMAAGIAFTAGYIAYFKYLRPELDLPQHWLLQISPEGIGTVGMLLNFAVTIGVSLLTRPPPEPVQELVASLRFPREAGPAAAGRRASGPGR
jgi:cation/acetate symporter